VILLFVLLHIAGMTGMCHHTQPLVEMGSCELFAWPQNMILLISASQVASITGINHPVQPRSYYFITLSLRYFKITLYFYQILRVVLFVSHCEESLSAAYK
jgi:hypothetical protein